MERFSPEGVKPYIPYERRMLVDHIRRTIGQPVLGVIMARGEHDILACAGINHGFVNGAANNVYLKPTESDVRGYGLDEHAYIAGHEEIDTYLAAQLDGWHVDAHDPVKLGQLTDLILTAQTLEVKTERNLEDELDHVWEAVCDLVQSNVARDRQDVVDMLAIINESGLSGELEQLMRSVVRQIESLSEIESLPYLAAYLEVLAGNHVTFDEQTELLQKLHQTPANT